MTAFSIKPFATADDGKTTAVHAPTGVFTVEDAEVVDLLRRLKIAKCVDASELESHIPSDLPKAEMVLDYLKNDLAILDEVNPKVRGVRIEADAETTKLIEPMLSGTPLEMRSSDYPEVVLCIVTKGDVIAQITEARDALCGDDVLICLFGCQNEIVVTPPWRRGLGLPCPVCCLEFLLDTRFDGGQPHEISLGDALAMLRNHGFNPVPWLPLKARDVQFGARYAVARCEQILGLTVGWDERDDLRKMLRIGLNSLTPTFNYVPLGSTCRCLELAREE